MAKQPILLPGVRPLAECPNGNKCNFALEMQDFESTLDTSSALMPVSSQLPQSPHLPACGAIVGQLQHGGSKHTPNIAHALSQAAGGWLKFSPVRVGIGFGNKATKKAAVGRPRPFACHPVSRFLVNSCSSETDSGSVAAALLRCCF